MIVVWVVAPCSLVEVYSLSWWWRQQAPLKRRLTPTRLHGATQKTSSFSPPWEPEISPIFNKNYVYRVAGPNSPLNTSCHCIGIWRVGYQNKPSSSDDSITVRRLTTNPQAIVTHLACSYNIVTILFPHSLSGLWTLTRCRDRSFYDVQ
jgi:hypothetical protein